MKNTVFLAFAFAAIAALAQKSYPECLLTDCIDFLTITVGCGYSNTNADITAAQLSCICGAPRGPAEYQNCVTCMNLDPANTVNYDTAGCSGSGNTPSSVSSSSSTRVSGSSASGARPPSSSSSTGQPTRTMTPTQGIVPVVPTAAGGGLQGFGGCPNNNCGSGDSTKANIYDVSKDSNVVSGAKGAVGRGTGMWYGAGAGLAVLVGLVWL